MKDSCDFGMSAGIFSNSKYRVCVYLAVPCSTGCENIKGSKKKECITAMNMNCFVIRNLIYKKMQNYNAT
jgi:hypothetical protein